MGANQSYTSVPAVPPPVPTAGTAALPYPYSSVCASPPSACPHKPPPESVPLLDAIICHPTSQARERVALYYIDGNRSEWQLHVHPGGNGCFTFCLESVRTKQKSETFRFPRTDLDYIVCRGTFYFGGAWKLELFNRHLVANGNALCWGTLHLPNQAAPLLVAILRDR